MTLRVDNLTVETLLTASTSGLTDSTNKRFVTDAHITVLGNTTGTNSGDQTLTLTGNVTGSGTGSFVTTIANDAVTYAKIQNISAGSKMLGRGSAGGSGDVEEITLGSGLTMSGTTINGYDITVLAKVFADSPVTAVTRTILLCNASGGNMIINLPAAAANFWISIMKTDSSANTVTIDGAGSETINGALTNVLSAQYSSSTIVSAGTNMFIV